MKLNPKREVIDGQGYLSIYDEHGHVLARNTAVENQDAMLEYEGILYMAGTDGRVWLNFESLKHKFQN